ncbi:MAG: hypothetical protein IH969_03930 [Candidatus Krumholzibacteriota bacterium]|nr:hypothetical protein [Candidatus Krumholzibacteriota bacterium]
MLKRSNALVCLGAICGMMVFAGCGGDAPPSVTAPPPPSVEPSPPPTPSDQNPKFLTRADRTGHRIIAGVCRLPDIAVDIVQSSGEYRLDLDRSFVVSGTANGVDVEITYLAMPSVRSPQGEWKYIINVQTKDTRISGAVIATDQPTPGARQVDGVWLSPRAHPRGRPVDQRWGRKEWFEFFECVAERAPGNLIACSVTCAWWGTGWPACTTVCFTAQTLGDAVTCLVRVSTASDVNDIELQVFR